MTKKDWRKVIIRALCEANLPCAARVRAQPNFLSDECREGLRTVPELSTWNDRRASSSARSGPSWYAGASVRVCCWLLPGSSWRGVTSRGAARHDVAAAGVGALATAVACDVALVVVFVTMPPPPHVPVFFAHGTASATLPRPPGRRLAVSKDCANVLPVLSDGACASCAGGRGTEASQLRHRVRAAAAVAATTRPTSPMPVSTVGAFAWRRAAGPAGAASGRESRVVVVFPTTSVFRLPPPLLLLVLVARRRSNNGNATQCC